MDKNQNHCFHNILLEKCLCQLAKKNDNFFDGIIMFTKVAKEELYDVK